VRQEVLVLRSVLLDDAPRPPAEHQSLALDFDPEDQ